MIENYVTKIPRAANTADGIYRCWFSGLDHRVLFELVRDAIDYLVEHRRLGCIQSALPIARPPLRAGRPNSAELEK